METSRWVAAMAATAANLGMPDASSRLGWRLPWRNILLASIYYDAFNVLSSE